MEGQRKTKGKSLLGRRGFLATAGALIARLWVHSWRIPWSLLKTLQVRRSSVATSWSLNAPTILSNP